MLCVVLNASLLLKCHCCLCRVPYCQKTSHTLFIHVSPHVSVYGSTTVHKLWSTVHQRHREPHIISTAHVFEEVEVSQPNAKQDLSGLSPGLKQSSLLLTLFHNWEFRNTRHMNQKATDFSRGTGCWAFFFLFFSEAPTDRKPFSWVSSLMFGAFISDWSLCSLISWGQPSMRAH